MNTPNVRCAGGATVAVDFYRKHPCTWKGRRPTEPRIQFGNRIASTPRGGDPTVKPCPRCGGRVELIPERPR